MTDFQLLLLVLGLLYLSECLFRMRPGSVLVGRWFPGKSWTFVLNPSPGIGARRTGVVFLNPLPPFGTAFVCHAWPVAMTPAASCSLVTSVINGYDKPDHAGVHVLWDDLWQIERKGDLILVNQKPFARCNGERLAQRMVAVMRAVKAARPERRDAIILRALARAASPRRVGREIQRFNLAAGGTSPLRWQAHLLFLVIFGLLPAAIGIPAVRPYLPTSLLLLAGLLVIQGSTFYYLHRRFFPEFSEERWRAALTMVFTPTASIRACDSLAQHFLAAYDPLAVALVLCRGRPREEFARRVLLDARYPMPSVYSSGDPGGHATADAFREKLAVVLAQATVGAGLDPGLLTAPPVQQDPQARSFCPRCDGEFLVEEGVCEHCGGLPLTPFSQSTAAGEQAVATGA